MPLISTIIIGCVLTFGLINGLRHGGIKEGIALVGVLLGALLVEFWIERWGLALSERSGLKLDNAKWVISLSLLIGTALFSGYGSGIFVRRGVLKTRERLGGALLGLLNMGLLVSFTLRYTQQFYFIETDPAQPQVSWIRQGALSRYMVDWVGFLLIGAAVAIGVVALITRAMWIARLATQQPAPKPTEAKPKTDAPKKPATVGAGAASNILIGGSSGGSGGSAGGSQPQKTAPVGQQEKFIEVQSKTGQ
jgi:uncharacterized membrane protein required for colicin V production